VGELDAATVIAIQRDWHMRGQNGCVFAMHAARKLNHRQWRYEVYPQVPDKESIAQSIVSAIQDSENQILSLIFPAVECPHDVRGLVSFAESVGCYQAERPEAGSGLVSLRYRVGEAESWIIGFAPLDTLPLTRRAPFTELAKARTVKILGGEPARCATKGAKAKVTFDLSAE
jgi:hypothetical protein